MPVMKIPTLLLQQLRCQCGRYLSKTPINIRDGQSICKDCMDPTTPINGSNTPYEALASLFAFPCRFELQGCPKHIKFEDVANHEAICAYRTHNCPVSLHGSCNWKGAISQLHVHYESEHHELCLESAKFNIKTNEDYEQYRLINIDGVLLMLQIKCDVAADKLWFNTVCFRNLDDAAFLNYSVELKSNERFIRLENVHAMPIAGMQMVPGESLEVDLLAAQTLLKYPEFIECCWIINITDEFKNKVKQQQKLEARELFDAKKERIKCPNCGIYMVPPIYLCDQEHLTCLDCKGYYGECKRCQKKNVEFTRALDVEELAKSGQHSCRWVSCRLLLPYEEVRLHEQICVGRIYNCPVCSIWSGKHDEIVEHFKTIHSDSPIYDNMSVSILTSNSPFTGTIDMNSTFGYMLIHRELFKFRAQQNTVDVWYLGAPNYADCWECKVTGAPVDVYLRKLNLNLYSNKIQSNLFGSGNASGLVSIRRSNLSLVNTPSSKLDPYILHITKIK